MKTVAIIQARMGSTRLPGKVLKQIFGKSVLEHIVSRVFSADVCDEVIVATTAKPKDDVIEDEAKTINALVHRGSELDVIQRFYDAARANSADIIIRVTSDCPLYDPHILRDMHNLYLSQQPDYLSNTIERTFPRGLDTEIFSFQTLEKISRLASQAYEREHVTPYIYEHPREFAIIHYKQSEDYSGLRWTLDTDEDWLFINEVYNNLYLKNSAFSTSDVLKLLSDKPHLQEINSHIEQKPYKPA